MFTDLQTKNNRLKKKTTRETIKKLLAYLKAPSSFKLTMF